MSEASRVPVRPAGATPSPNPLTAGIIAGGFVFISGQTGQQVVNGQPVYSKDIKEQTRGCLDKLRSVLDAAGSSLEKVVKCTVFITDMAEFAAMNDVYRTYFPADPPARSTVQVAALARPELKVEIEAVALA